MEKIKGLLGVNWKTNLAAIVSFLLSVPQFITATTNWLHHEPADWRGAIAAVVIAAGFAFSKDASNHSTAEQVQAATEQAKQP